MARSVWSGHLAFGLVSIPIKLYVAAREKRVDLHMLHEPCESGVKQKYVCEDCGVEVPRTGGPKYFALDKATKVVLTPEELATLDPPTSKISTVLKFVRTSEVNPLYYGSSFYVAPDEGGERPYALLTWAMREKDVCAVAKITMSSREHVVLLRPAESGMTMHHMFYQNEVAFPERVPDLSGMKLSEQERSLANLLVDSMVEEFDFSGYEDERAANLRRLIEAKAVGAAAPTNVVEMVPREVPDILEALRASLALKRA